MNHRKIYHPDLAKPCINNMEGKCKFTAEICWWNHNNNNHQNNEITGQFICYSCNQQFTNKSTLMTHRKQMHPNTCKPCNKFTQGQCRYKDEYCWFTHTVTASEQQSNNKINSNNLNDIAAMINNAIVNPNKE